MSNSILEVIENPQKILEKMLAEAKNERKRYKSYVSVDNKTGQIYARVQIRQTDGRYKSYRRKAESEVHARHVAKELMLEIVFSEVLEKKIAFDEFKERISKIYE